MSQVDVEQGVGYLVKRAQQQLRLVCDEELRPLGLSMSQYAVLRALADHPAASSAELARLCFVTRQSLQDVLRGLRQAELARVSDQPTTGRSRPVELTAEGRKSLRAAHRAVLRVEERMLTGLTRRSRDELAALLRTCVGNLSGHPEAG